MGKANDPETLASCLPDRKAELKLLSRPLGFRSLVALPIAPAAWIILKAGKEAATLNYCLYAACSRSPLDWQDLIPLPGRVRAANPSNEGL